MPNSRLMNFTIRDLVYVGTIISSADEHDARNKAEKFVKMHNITFNDFKDLAQMSKQLWFAGSAIDPRMLKPTPIEVTTEVLEGIDPADTERLIMTLLQKPYSLKAIQYILQKHVEMLSEKQGVRYELDSDLVHYKVLNLEEEGKIVYRCDVNRYQVNTEQPPQEP